MNISYKITERISLNNREAAPGKKWLMAFCACLFFISFINYKAIAQQSVNACGGNGLGTGGVTNFTVGQIDFTNATGSSWAVTEGVQQTYIYAADSIGGAGTVCQGSSLTLTDSIAGGTWSSYNPAIATVGATTGIVTGISGGVDLITYSAVGYLAIKAITVNPLPGEGVISGVFSVCAGSTVTLTDTTGSGIWSASNGNASVSGGVVTGIAVGSDSILYTTTNACGTSTIAVPVTINLSVFAGAISGAGSVCQGATITLTDTTTGGTWSTTNDDVTISGSSTTMPVITGVSGGVDTIRYSVSNSCGTATAFKIVTVHPLPYLSPLSGPTSVCAGLSISLTDSISGGTWGTSNAHAVVLGGVVTGVSSGTDTIVYVKANSCGSTFVSKVIVVDGVPFSGVIIGASHVCESGTITLTESTPGGSWNVSNAHATVSAGIVTGVSSGLDSIKYTVVNICGTATASYPVTITPLPAIGVITGDSIVCPGMAITLADTMGGGAWSVTNSHAIISGGIVTGIYTGADSVKYSLTNACGTSFAAKIITIGAPPAATSVTGASSVCVGATISLTGGSAGGTWDVSNADATVTVGLVTGVSAGTVMISYTISNTCGSATTTKSVTVLPLPVVEDISGSSSVCEGLSITLTDATSGGTWSASNTNASVTGGTVTGIASGTDSIKYSVANACGTTTVAMLVTVNAIPVAGVITGPTYLCQGTAITLVESASGGTWSVSNGSASISGSSSTITVTGISGGTDSISYTVINGCGSAVAAVSITVIPIPNAGIITGGDSICIGGTTTLVDGVPSGTWSISNTFATVSSAGIVTGDTAGIDTIQYRVSNACGSDSTIFPVHILTPAVCTTLHLPKVPALGWGIAVYPNPNNGTFTIEIPELSNYVSIAVYDMYGNAVVSKEIEDNKEFTIPINMAQVARATYMLKVIANGKTYTQKLVIAQ